MSRRRLVDPVNIRPELLRVGDDVQVTYKADRGVTASKRGIIATRDDHGHERTFLTEEGAVLLVWTPGQKPPTVTLLGRVENPQEELFTFDNTEVLARI